METLETSSETVGITPLSLVDEMETIWKHDTNVETSCLQAIARPQCNQFICGTRSTGLAARINSTEVHHDEHDKQIYDDKAGGERTGSVSGNRMQMGARRCPPREAVRKKNYQDSVRRSRALSESEPRG